MNEKKLNNFEDRFGCIAPPALVAWLDDERLHNNYPAAFILDNVSWVVEIQYLLDIDGPVYFGAEKKFLAFAVTTDGFDLLIDLSTPHGSILQKEYDDVDYLGISLQDLISAKKEKL